MHRVKFLRLQAGHQGHLLILAASALPEEKGGLSCKGEADIITTGYVGAGLLDPVRQKGAAGLINKPYSVQELVEKVQETLAAPNPTA